VRPGQKLSREISHNLGGCVRAGDRFQRLDKAVQHAVANCVGEGHVPVIARRLLRQLGLHIMQVINQGFGDGSRSESGANVLTSIVIL
jgi:hypothetical protein